VPRPGPLPEGESAFLTQLRRIGVTRSEEISARTLGAKPQVEALFAALAAPVNSDFHPFVQLEAPRARFERSTAQALVGLATASLPIVEMTGERPAVYLKEPAPDYVSSLRLRSQSAALEIARVLTDRTADPLRSPEKAVIPTLLALKRPGALCDAEPSAAALEQLRNAADTTLANLPLERRRALWIERKWLGCAPRSSRVRQMLEAYAAVAARDARAMLDRARALLAGPSTGTADWDRYLLATAMLGAHAAGEHEEARRLWNGYGSRFYPNGNIPPALIYLANLR
jgi:hypothetical protein